MKIITILLTTILLSITSVHSEEKVKTLADIAAASECYAKNKISPDTFSCSVKKAFHNLYTKEDGSLNALGKFFNAKTLQETGYLKVKEKK